MSVEKDKRIPVSEETLEEIKSLGHKGETYDELLQKMARAYKKHKLKKDLREEGVPREAIEQILESEKDYEEGRYETWEKAKKDLKD